MMLNGKAWKTITNNAISITAKMSENWNPSSSVELIPRELPSYSEYEGRSISTILLRPLKPELSMFILTLYIPETFSACRLTALPAVSELPFETVTVMLLSEFGVTMVAFTELTLVEKFFPMNL